MDIVFQTFILSLHYAFPVATHSPPPLSQLSRRCCQLSDEFPELKNIKLQNKLSY